MKIYAILAILLLAPPSSLATENEPQIAIFGPGLFLCSNYVDERLIEKDKETFDSWIAGFVSSLSIYYGRKINFAREIKSLITDVEKRCQSEPNIFFAEAVSEAFTFWIESPLDQ